MDTYTISQRRQSTQVRLLRSLCIINPRDLEELSAAAENQSSATLLDLNLDPLYKKMGEKIYRWYSKYMSPPVISELVKVFEADRDIELLELTKQMEVSEFAFRGTYAHLIDQYREDTGKLLLEKTIQNTSNIISDDGLEIFEKRGSRTLKGPNDATDYLSSEVNSIRSVLNPAYRDKTIFELTEILARKYREKKMKGAEPRVYTGIPNIDDDTNGGKAGEIWTLAGFVGHGKTTVALNWTYRALMDNDQTTVIYYSFEMPEEQVLNILLTRHNYELSRSEGFNPLSYDVFRDKVTTNREDEDLYYYTLESFSNATDGRLEIKRPKGPMGLSDVRNQAEATHRRLGGLDLLVVDYLALVGPDTDYRGSKSKSDVLNYNFAMLKRIAMEFARGEGVFILTPHQINRAGHRSARDTDDEGANNGMGPVRGVYQVEALADANECERSSDVIWTIYQDSAYRQENRGVMCCLKNRDGAIPAPFFVEQINRFRYVDQINAGQEELFERDFLNS